MTSHRRGFRAAGETPTFEPMTTMTIRRANERGHAEHGWLDSHHTFSFADYFDPDHMGFRTLRVINEDRVEPGKGFGTHGHRDMEIISYVLEGALEHKDSMGTGSVIHPGDVQRMSAGTGVRHSEFNGSKSDPVHFLQIWITPDKAGYEPSYEEKSFSQGDKQGRLRLIGSRDGRDGSVTIHQDTSLYAGIFAKGEEATFEIAKGRHVWLHVAKGSVTVNGEVLRSGDAVAIEEPGAVKIAGQDSGEILLFDLG